MKAGRYALDITAYPEGPEVSAVAAIGQAVPEVCRAPRKGPWGATLATELTGSSSQVQSPSSAPLGAHWRRALPGPQGRGLGLVQRELDTG